MNKRDEAIMRWIEKNRQDFVPLIKPFLERPDLNRGLYATLCIAFEAGREFQHENPALGLGNPNVYA